MPELPDLEVIRRRLAPRLVGVAITSARVRRPLVVRNLLGGDFAGLLVGRRFEGAERRGKFLLLALDNGNTLAINPTLAGRLRHGDPLGRDRTRDALVLGLGDGHELRYHDAVDMGKVYLTDDLNKIPAFSDQGPEANDPNLTMEAFRKRWRSQSGEVKNILTRQAFVAGIGNAYADEICWRAQIYPFRRKASLSEEEVARLYTSMRAAVQEAIDTLEHELRVTLDDEERGFLAVHGKAGQPCLRCGGLISEVTREGRPTNFCRTCQPGLLAGGKGHTLP
jgi:formamidopyrimidine-DNA glycosylase